MRQYLTYNFCYILSKLTTVIELLKEVVEGDYVVQIEDTGNAYTH